MGLVKSLTIALLSGSQGRKKAVILLKPAAHTAILISSIQPRTLTAARRAIVTTTQAVVAVAAAAAAVEDCSRRFSQVEVVPVATVYPKKKAAAPSSMYSPTTARQTQLQCSRSRNISSTLPPSSIDRSSPLGSTAMNARIELRSPEQRVY